MGQEDREVCDHPFRRWPNPLPADGTPCPRCGQPYRRPALASALSPEEYRRTQQFWELVSLWLLVEEYRRGESTGIPDEAARRDRLERFDSGLHRETVDENDLSGW